ncbi:hypothetical protein DFH08DRAFT_1036272 [Mycena albidolilacea]|uniref:DUF6532 domain-containing protein n=1 Tax=Mycena albidolilacea TaxID=1033008 RepID=A0AAD6ZDE6_9AGAR|nr:hypothetical protein DFH08DRAFT_1036272 [Mycena albidolilacea]
MAPEPADNTTLTRAQKRQLTVAECQEKARQGQKAFEAQSKASGGRQAKLVAQKNAIWNVDKPVSCKRTSSTAKVSETAKKPREAIAAAQSDAEENAPADEPQAKTTVSAKRKYAAPVIAIDSDSDHTSTKASMTSTKSSLKLPRIDFTNLPAFTVKSNAVGKVKAVAKTALRKVANVGKSAKAKVSSKVPAHAKIVAESASEAEATSSDEDGSERDNSNSDMADDETADDDEFMAEASHHPTFLAKLIFVQVPRVVSKKAASIKTFESKDMEVRDCFSLLKAQTSTTTLRDEAKWHPSAQIIYPAPGKKDILLNSQTEVLQRVLRAAISLVKTGVLFENSYPAIISRAGFARAYLVSAAEAMPEAKYVLERLGLDLKYAAILADILLDRINILRGDIKRSAAGLAPGYFQFAGLNETKTKELIEKLLKDHRRCQRLMTEKPFHHPALKAIVKDGVFNRNFKAKNMHLFISTSKKHPTHLELPDAMVALAATALYAALLEYRTTGERQVIAFTEGAYEDTYRNHMKTLADTRDAAPVALHKVLHGLFNDVTDGKATAPEAGSSATLINLVEVPDSD